jgi:muramoyltetrapeptide carboxypeptidase
VGLTPRTTAGLRKCRALRPGSRVALVAPASGFDRGSFDRGVAELMRLGLTPVYEDSIFERQGFVAGSAATRAAALEAAWRTEADAIVAVRGGYGSVETLPLLDGSMVPEHPAALVGYSDITSLHVWLNLHVGVTSIHGVMLDGRLAEGTSAYDEESFWRCLSGEPLGELAPAGLDVVHHGEATGVLLGGTVSQLAGSLGTPYAFVPPPGAVLFLDEVGERPYRLRRMLTQLQQAGTFSRAAGIVVGQLPRCDEPGGSVSALSVVAEFFEGFQGPVLTGFPSGHTTTPLISLPLGVQARVVTRMGARLVIEEAAAI